MPQNAAYLRVALSNEQSAHEPDTVLALARAHPKWSIQSAVDTARRAEHGNAYHVKRIESSFPPGNMPPIANNNFPQGNNLLNEELSESLLPLPGSKDIAHVCAENTVLRRELAATQRALEEARWIAECERFTRETWEWLYDAEHIYGENMSIWRLALRAKMTPMLMKGLKERQRALERDFASRKLCDPLPPPGCIEEFHERCRRARNGDFRR